MKILEILKQFARGLLLLLIVVLFLAVLMYLMTSILVVAFDFFMLEVPVKLIFFLPGVIISIAIVIFGIYKMGAKE